MTPLHETARQYAKVGIPVFPCWPGSKRPVTENGFHDSTTDLELIDIWWKQNPNYNIAFCPEHAGLFVVDIDPGADPDIISKFPPTYQVKTPRGGWHLYYQGTGRSSASKIAPHVDTRGIGGYVLVPPSRVNGVSYQLEHDLPYAPIPKWIKSALATSHTPVAAAVDDMDLPANIARARQRLEYYVKKEDVAIEGCGGDNRTYQLCCEMLELGLTPETARDLIDEIWNPHCEPPWLPEELDVKLNNAVAYRQNEIGAFAVTTSEEAFGDAVKKLCSAMLRPVSMAELLTRTVSPVQELISGILEKNIATILSAPGGTHKSRLLLQWLLCTAAEVKIFGREVLPATSIYLSYEVELMNRSGYHAQTEHNVTVTRKEETAEDMINQIRELGKKAGWTPEMIETALGSTAIEGEFWEMQQQQNGEAVAGNFIAATNVDDDDLSDILGA